MAKVAMGVFLEHDDADNAVNDLHEAGFNAKDISVMMKTPPEGQKFSGNNVVVSNGVVQRVTSDAAYGGILGGLAGLLVGISATVIPGLGGLLVAGPLAGVIGLHSAAATTMTGIVAGGATGGIVGVLQGFGVSQEQAKQYETRIQQGGVLVAVPVTDANQEKAEAILDEHGAEEMRTFTA